MSTPYRVKNTFVEHYHYKRDNERLARSNSWSHSQSSGALSRSSSSHSEHACGAAQPQSSASQTRPEESHVSFGAQTSSESASEGSWDVRSERQRRRKHKGKVEQEQEVPLERREQELPLERRQAKVASQSDIIAALHEGRKCIPCASMEVVRYCKDGNDCKFCHLSHADHKMQRPGKEVRIQCKKALHNLLAQKFDSEGDRVLAVQTFLNRQAPFVRKYSHKLLGGGDEAMAQICVLDDSGYVIIAHALTPGSCGPRVVGKERVSL
eukprot:TRINITY_DN64609_c0_g1_i1.p1 TRINITY_DN64609_c0_g1~~TRINITY_DN64609_c0_g1_i1.p1  ORF type:complete len:267 (+),score=35.95 TRINITY_DN64609_c0_g1_i1:112-912(+)